MVRTVWKDTWFHPKKYKTMLHISVLKQKKLLLSSLEQCFSKFMNHWENLFKKQLLIS